MMYFDPNNVPKHKLISLIGEEIKSGVTGSTTYFIKFFESTETIEWIEHSKGIFQIFQKGLLLRIFKSNRSISIPIPFTQLKKFELCKGQETVKPIFLSPFWILLSFGVRVEIARYFKIKAREYSITPTILKIETQTFQLGLETNGYLFENQKNLFLGISEIKDLQIIVQTPNTTLGIASGSESL